MASRPETEAFFAGGRGVLEQNDPNRVREYEVTAVGNGGEKKGGMSEAGIQKVARG